MPRPKQDPKKVNTGNRHPNRFNPFNLTPKAAFEEVYNGSPNFMTPEIMSYGVTNDHLYWYEISWGWGFESRKTKTCAVIVGVTFIERRTKKKAHDISQSFHSDTEIEKRYGNETFLTALNEALSKANNYLATFKYIKDEQ